MEETFTILHGESACRIVDISPSGLSITFLGGDDWPDKITFEYSLERDPPRKRNVKCHTVWETSMNFYKTNSDVIVRRRGLQFMEPESSDVKELHRHRVESPEFTGKFELPIPIPLFEASKEHIFVGNGKLGYEILVFDLDGNFVRTISKEYKPIEVSEDNKNEIEAFLEDSEFSFLIGYSLL